MKASEFDSIVPFYRSILLNLEKQCLLDNIDILDYETVFLNFIEKYHNSLEMIEKIKKLDFNNVSQLKAVLNKSAIHSKAGELRFQEHIYQDSKKEIFNWLDKVSNPYFYLFNPYYKYGANLYCDFYLYKIWGYQKSRYTGLKNVGIACEYANYLILKKL